MARSYNRVELIGNLTRDPELRYAGSGTAVCVFGLATNRGRTSETGERVEETQYHRIVAFRKLAEQCVQLLVKGRKVFVAGRLEYRTYINREGIEQTAAEVVLDDMLLLDAKHRDEPAATAEMADQVQQAGDSEAGASASVPDHPDHLDVTTARQYTADEIPF